MSSYVLVEDGIPFEVHASERAPTHVSFREDCPDCEGTGQDERGEDCRTCEGTGKQ